MRHQGSVVVSSLVIVVIAAALAAALSWQGLVSVSRTELLRDQAQAQWIARAAVRYAQWVLAVDAGLSGGRSGGGGLASAPNSDTTIDHLAEPWAQQIQTIRIAELFATQASKTDLLIFGEARFSGGIIDEQSKFNVWRATRNGLIQPEGQLAFVQLAGFAGLGTNEAEQLLSQLREDSAVFDAAIGAGAPSIATRIKRLESRVLRVTQRPQARENLLKWLTWIPQMNVINVNTAPAEVIAATLGQSGTAQALAYIETRERFPMRTVSEALALLNADVGKAGLMSTQTNYFVAQGSAEFGRAELPFRAWIQRTGQRAQILSYQEGAM